MSYRVEVDPRTKNDKSLSSVGFERGACATGNHFPLNGTRPFGKRWSSEQPVLTRPNCHSDGYRLGSSSRRSAAPLTRLFAPEGTYTGKSPFFGGSNVGRHQKPASSEELRKGWIHTKRSTATPAKIAAGTRERFVFRSNPTSDGAGSNLDGFAFGSGLAQTTAILASTRRSEQRSIDLAPLFEGAASTFLLRILSPGSSP